MDDYFGNVGSWRDAILLTICIIFVFPPLWSYLKLLDARDKLFGRKKQ